MHIAAAVAIALMIFLAYRHGCAPPRWSTCARSRSTSRRRRCKWGQERTPPVFSLVERAGRLADLGIKLHANYMLRHSTGYNDALMMLRLNMACPHLMSASRRPWIALDTSMSFSSSCWARCSRVRSLAFVGRRGVEWRATVRISVVGVTGARCGFVIDLWAFRRATVQ